MEVFRTIQTNITLLPSQLQSGLDEVILAEARKKLENKCYNGTFISKVEKIQKDRINISTYLDASCMVNIIAHVKTISYYRGDVIIVKVLSVDPNGNLTATNNLCSCIINQSASPAGVQVGEKIPVIIYSLKYTPSLSKISAQCIGLVPLTRSVNFCIKEIVEYDPAEMIAKISELEGIVSGLPKPAVEYFKKLLFPYSDNTGLSIINMKFKIGQHVCRDKTLFGSPFYQIKTESGAADVASNVVVDRFLGDYIRELKNIITLSELYEDRDKLKHVWEHCKKLKI